MNNSDWRLNTYRKRKTHGSMDISFCTEHGGLVSQCSRVNMGGCGVEVYATTEHRRRDRRFHADQYMDIGMMVIQSVFFCKVTTYIDQSGASKEIQQHLDQAWRKAALTMCLRCLSPTVDVDSIYRFSFPL
ncbi:hypothetical protein TEQG_05086 [Trichophyton equinum CBS 127.97]|uniref:Uncharacterized protein n=1 Tax=Trichophyton equinum (strain ATCC MYA-4606 / CBS 127.97) TaxID=559882 RepID=F2PWC2_TRIEC|nr:hypothetical protein TEQG_05086 [Trichophyton equinum CBS 127.97]